MNEIERLYVSRNDFESKWKCEQCGHIMTAWGYNDNNFYENVIPNAICPVCGKSASGETAKEQRKRLGRTYRL